MKKLSRILVAILSATTILMSVLFITTRANNRIGIEFGRSCIQSFSTAVDYILCRTDYDLDNIKNFDTCGPYLEATMEEAIYVNKEL